MAEVVGLAASAATLAGLFMGCIRAFELIHIVKTRDIELEKLNLKLNIEKCRLLIWGQSMGLSVNDDSGIDPLFDCAFRVLVENTLQLILRLLTDSSELSRKYGCQSVPQGVPSLGMLEHNRASAVDRLNAAFQISSADNVLGEMGQKVRNMARWAVHDRKQFKLLISDAKDLIDGLQEITKGVASKPTQNRAMMSRIQMISDQETLSLISEICEEDHPTFSDAASCRIDAISMAPTKFNDIAEWNSHVEDDASSTSELLRAMEDWTVSEYRQRFLDLFDLRSQALESKASFSCSGCGTEFSSAKDLMQHAKEEDTCPCCSQAFDCHGQLLLHCKQTETTCDYCVRSFNCLGLLHRHTQETNFDCHVCHASFRCGGQLENHDKGSHCSICSTKFSCPDQRQIHAEKECICVHCLVDFRCHGLLLRHANIDATCEGCRRGFGCRNLLRKHSCRGPRYANAEQRVSRWSEPDSRLTTPLEKFRSVY
jgi:hypothetical protein